MKQPGYQCQFVKVSVINFSWKKKSNEKQSKKQKRHVHTHTLQPSKSTVLNYMTENTSVQSEH